LNPFDIFLPIWNPFLTLLETGLSQLAAITGSAGLAIILFTVLLKLLLLPLSLAQTKSMKGMQAIQPELQQLRKKHGKDRERMAQEQMRLYKEHGVNPAAGCLPMIPMMFVLIGLYQALINLTCDPNNPSFCNPAQSDPAFRESWLWIENLGAPDIPFYLPGDIPVPGILPIVMLITQFIYGKMTPMTGASDDPQQQMMQRMTTYFMPIMLFVFSFNFPAGLVLYWVVSNVFEILRMGFTVSWDPVKPSVLFAGMPGKAFTSKASNGVESKRAPAEAAEPSKDGVNPRPTRPPSGSRRKKGKRGGKR
jgi:YidC/Oxa1 family membrane protein insertase